MLKLISLLVFPLEIVLTWISKYGTSLVLGNFALGRTTFRNMVVLLFPFYIFMPSVNLWLICLQWELPSIRTWSSPSFHLITCLPRSSLIIGRIKMFILGFVKFCPTLTIYDIAHSLLVGVVSSDVAFI